MITGSTPISQFPTGTIDNVFAVYPLSIGMLSTPQTIRASLSQTAQFLGSQGLMISGSFSLMDGRYLPSGTSQQIMGSSAGTNITAGQTRYIGLYHMDATESLAYIPFAKAGVIQRLFVYAQGSPGAGQSWTCTLRKTLAATALTCTIGAGTNTANDTTHKVAVAAGDRWALEVVASAGASSSDIAFSFEFVG